MKTEPGAEAAKIFRYHEIITRHVRGRQGRVEGRIGAGFHEDRHETSCVNRRRPLPRNGDNSIPEREHWDRDDIVQVYPLAGTSPLNPSSRFRIHHSWESGTPTACLLSPKTCGPFRN